MAAGMRMPPSNKHCFAPLYFPALPTHQVFQSVARYVHLLLKERLHINREGKRALFRGLIPTILYLPDMDSVAGSWQNT